MPPRRSIRRKKTMGTFIVEDIVGKRFTRVRGREVAEYYVKWLNYPSESNTWEPFRNFKNPQMVDDYNERIAAREVEAANEVAEAAVFAAAEAAAVVAPAPSSSSSPSCASSGTASLNLQTPSTSGGTTIDNSLGASTSASSISTTDDETLDRSKASFSAPTTPTGPSTSGLASQAQNETLANSGSAQAPVVDNNERIDEPLSAPSTSTGTPSTSSGTSIGSRPVLQAGFVAHYPGPAVYEVISNQDGVLVSDLTYLGKTVKIAEIL